MSISHREIRGWGYLSASKSSPVPYADHELNWGFSTLPIKEIDD